MIDGETIMNNFLRPKYARNIETHLQSIAPDLYDGLYEQVKAKVLAYISDLADHQNKPVVMMLIKAGMVKRLVGEGLITV